MESRFLLSTYYVDDTGGNDNSADPTSPATPWATLQKAADTVVSGDTVRVRASTYAGFRRYNVTGGTAANPISFLADPGVLVNSFGVNGTNAFINIENTSAVDGYYIVDGFEITGGTRGLRSSLSRYNTFRNNVVHANGTNIFASSSDGILVENNLTYGATDEHGIYVNGSTNYVIRGNAAYGNAWNGIHTNISVGTNQVNSYGLIENNVVHGNGLAGCDFTGMNNSIVRNNVIYKNSRHSMVFQNSPSGANVPVSYGNTIVNNTCYETNLDSSFAIQFSADSLGGGTSNDANTTVFNNILIAGASAGNGSIGFTGSTVASTFKSDYNVFVDSFRIGTNSSITFSSWKSATFQDAHSTVPTTVTDVFESASGDDYHLKAGSDAIDRGIGTFNSKDAPKVDFEGDLTPADDTTPDAGYDRYRPSTGWVNFSSGVLTVTGSASGETIRVYKTTADVFAKIGTSVYGPATPVNSISIDAGGGNDAVYVETASTPNNLGNVYISTPTLLDGGLGNDTLYGGNGNDTFFAGSVADGADVLNGVGGTDTADYSLRTANLTVSLDGTASDGQTDTDPGTAGNQSEGDNVKADVENVTAGSGSDTLTGSSGSNTLLGKAGTDLLYGDPPGTSSGGNDTVIGGDGNDSCFGGLGNDLVYGDDPADLSKSGNDVCYGDDPSYGGYGGDDTVDCGPGDDYGYGGYGNDTMIGGSGTDHLWGDAGNDSFRTYDGSIDTVDGGSGTDSILNRLDDNNNVVLDRDSGDIYSNVP